MRFLFFYLMSDDAERVRSAAPRHAAYWRTRAPRGYLGGPFADHSGGLVTFEARDPAEAEELVHPDPFLREGLLRSWWLEPWLAEAGVPTLSAAGEP